MQPFEKELLRNNSYFVETPCLNEEVEKIISLQEEKRQAFLVYSLAPIGKNFAFKNAINKRDGDKIFIDFNDISYKSCFPAYYLTRIIYEKLNEFGIKCDGDFPLINDSGVRIDVETHYDVLLGILKKDLYSLKLDKPLYILIGNVDMPFDNDFSMTFYNHFIFDKRELPKNLHVFLVTSSLEQVEVNKEFLEVVNLQGNKDNPKLFFKELLSKYSRTISDELLLQANPALKICDYVYIAGYAINYCGLKEYDLALKTLLFKNNTDEILLQIFNDFYNHLSKYGKVIFAEALLDLYMFNIGIYKNDVIESGKYLLGSLNSYLRNYEEITREEKELILTYLQFFTVNEADRLVIKDRVIREFIGTNAMYLTNLVTSIYQERLMAAVDYVFSDKDYVESEGYQAYKKTYLNEFEGDDTKTAKIYKNVYVSEFEREGRFNKKNIVRFAIFKPLCSRLMQFIKNYSYISSQSPRFSREQINGLELMMISFVERSSVIFEQAMDYGSFADLLSDKQIMYTILTKSRRMVKRLINRYINTCLDYQTRILGGEGDRSSVYGLITSIFSNVVYSDEMDAFSEELVVLVGEVLDQNEMLYNGVFKDKYLSYGISPITDYVLLSGNQSVIEDYAYLMDDLKEEELNFEYLTADLRKFCSSYENEENVANKLIYAYLAFRTYITLGENRKVNPQISSLLEPLMKDILMYSEYCYFPEVYGSIYMYFGRIYVKDYPNRLALGINLLKSQGYYKTISPFVTAWKYFASLAKKEGDR